MRRIAAYAGVILTVSCTVTGRQEAPASAHDHLLGVYASVTESECNVEIELSADGEALIRNTCRLEDGSGQDVQDSGAATWSFSSGKVQIHQAGRTTPFEYVAELPYASFGEGGAGPGLKPVGSGYEKVRLYGYGYLWKTPMHTKPPA